MEKAIYAKSENEILEYYIREEAEKNGLDVDTDIQPVVKIQLVLSGIFALILFFLTLTYFFHFRMPVYLLIFGVLPLYHHCMKKFTTMQHLIRQLKKRPDEEVGYVVYNTAAGKTVKSSHKKICWAILALGVLLPMLLFIRPHMLFERSDEGYYVRFYTRGIFCEETIEVPAQHRGENVVGLRGNVFARISGVNTILLPDTITHIRGYAFADCIDLQRIRMPETLSYLGGGAFSGCSDLQDVTIPQGLTEVKGNTFEYCRSLERIEIPEGVTRVGGHAFKNCTSLSNVSFPTTLEEIGGYAFAGCEQLISAVLPEGTEYRQSSFKDCPATVHFK